MVQGGADLLRARKSRCVRHSWSMGVVGCSEASCVCIANKIQGFVDASQVDVEPWRLSVSVLLTACSANNLSRARSFHGKIDFSCVK